MRDRVCLSTISAMYLLVFAAKPGISVVKSKPFYQGNVLPSTFEIVDLFAGPGGLGEGFASLVEGEHVPFRIGISIEKETSAHQTLRLRAFLREYRSRHGSLPEQFIKFHAGKTPEPDWGEVDARAWQQAIQEARCLELGTNTTSDAIEDTIEALKKRCDDTILIGGPPCQAYCRLGT